MSLTIKICGITDPASLTLLAEGGASLYGLVFYPPSPRYVTPDQAYDILSAAPAALKSVGLFVNPSDHDLAQYLSLLPLDYIQLHGEERPERVRAIAEKFNTRVIKAIRVKTPEDIDIAHAYEESADWLLFDSKIEADLPGGTGQRFDWDILQNKRFSIPWMLSGGLDAGNITEALSRLSPNGIDISSGVETARGVKDPNKIRDFLKICENF